MKELVWLQPGHSYFVNEHGRVVTNIAWDPERAYELLQEPDLSDFIVG